MCGEDECFVLVLGERLSVSIGEERDRFMVACFWSGGGCCYFFANMMGGVEDRVWHLCEVEKMGLKIDSGCKENK